MSFVPTGECLFSALGFCIVTLGFYFNTRFVNDASFLVIISKSRAENYPAVTAETAGRKEALVALGTKLLKERVTRDRVRSLFLNNSYLVTFCMCRRSLQVSYT